MTYTNNPLTAVERFAVDLSMNEHRDEADALLLLDAVFSRICHAHRETLTKCAQEMQDQMVEVLESWLPPDLQITDK